MAAPDRAAKDRLPPQLAAAWHEAWATLGLEPPAALLPRLVAAYGERHRRYHTLEHVRACLELAAGCRELQERPAELDLALWFHDAVYRTRRGDNEARSAAWAQQALLAAGAPPAVADRVAHLVLATRHPGPLEGGDAAVISDLDLAILGAPPAAFDAYEEQIRAEYRWVPRPLYRRRRAELLAELLRQGPLYRTETFRQRFEAAARENLERSLARLGAPRG